MSSSSNLTDADVTRILHLVDNLHDVEVRIEVEGMKLHVRKLAGERMDRGPATGTSTDPSAVDAAPSPSARRAESHQEPRRSTGANSHETQPVVIPPGAVAIRAPMLGRFFRAASPTDAPYVEVGSEVSPGDTVCIIEVMKLFNTVKAGVRGTIIGIAVENGDMVEHDSVLFVVRPA